MLNGVAQGWENRWAFGPPIAEGIRTRNHSLLLAALLYNEKAMDYCQVSQFG
jgi:hypothetical protein